MFKILKFVIKIIYIFIAVLIFARVFLKVNAVVAGAFNTKEKFIIDFIYNISDKLLYPVNFLLLKLQPLLPDSLGDYFPVMIFHTNYGRLEWAGIISLGAYIIIGMILEHIIHVISEYELAFINITKGSGNLLKNKKLQQLKAESESQNKQHENGDTLKNVYNLIIKRLDREKTELVNKNILLEKALITDTLTGLKTRKYLNERLKHEFSNSKIRKTPLSVIMLDIDHFKDVNDKFGHQIGDMVLKDVSKIVLNSCKLNIFAARYGGEEITIICPKYKTTEAQKLAETIRKTIETSLAYNNNVCSAITISAGVATFNGIETCKDPEELVDMADIALYKAKAAGRNQVQVYGS